MKKTLLFFITVIFFNFYVFADETDDIVDKNGNEKKYSPYFSLSNDSEFYIAKDLSEDTVFFNGYNNNSCLDMGISFTINNFLSASTFIGLRDLNWDIDNSGNFKFASAEVYIGFGLDIAPLDFFSINLKLSNYEVLEPENKINFGFDFETNFAFNFEKACIEFNICNNFNPCFNGKEAYIKDSISYELIFNFFNFLNDKINTGLYIEGTFESNNTFDNSDIKLYDFSNEFFAGIITKPLDYISGYLLFAMFNEASYKNNKVFKDSKVNSFGLKTGISFSYEIFSTELFYQPKIGVFIDNKDSETSDHTIGLSFSVEL